jgi:cytochrome c-type biogenesis protein CcmH/NrfF
MTRRLSSAVMLALLALMLAAPGATAACAGPKTSLPAIEDEVMCPICGVPLVNAGGPQAENEREFIRDRVDECKSKEEIKSALVAEYGEEVLAVPGDSGFDLAAYVVPAAGILLAGVAVGIGALRWRRSRDEGSPASADATRPMPGLDEDLRRYDL